MVGQTIFLETWCPRAQTWLMMGVAGALEGMAVACAEKVASEVVAVGLLGGTS